MTQKKSKKEADQIIKILEIIHEAILAYRLEVEARNELKFQRDVEIYVDMENKRRKQEEDYDASWVNKLIGLGEGTEVNERMEPINESNKKPSVFQRVISFFKNLLINKSNKNN